MILDRDHAVAATSDREPRRRSPEQGTPLAEFPWNDSIVGIGFFPHELALPDGWRWEPPR